MDEVRGTVKKESEREKGTRVGEVEGGKGGRE
jgi:hypothetical protein